MAKSLALPLAPLHHRVVVLLPLVVLDLTLVKDTQVDLVDLEDPLHHMAVVAHLLSQDTLTDQVVPLLVAPLDLVDHLVVQEALPTILDPEDHLHMEVLMVLAQVLMVLLLTEQWEDILVLEDHPCLEVQEALLLGPLEDLHNQDLLVPQVDQVDQVLVHTVAQLQIFRSCRTPSTRWRREE